MTDAIIHRCHAVGCKVAVKPELLCCLPHWRMVPRPIQLRVWAAYRPGQCQDKRPSLDWCHAADEAIAHIANLEGKKYDRLKVGFVVSFHRGAP